MTKPRRCRLAILASHPIQYFTPLYRRLASTPHLETQVLFCSDYGVTSRYDKQFDRLVCWDSDQLSGYEHVFLRNVSPVRDTFNPLHAINPGAFTRLLGSFDALWLNGYMYPSNLLALSAASMTRTRLLLRSELRLDPGRLTRRGDALRDWWIRKWVRCSDALLYIGSANREAYLHYGADETKLHFAPYSVDVDQYSDPALRDPMRRAGLRHDLGISPDAVVLLYVGKLTPRKHPERMLDVAGWCAPYGGRVLMVGSGPLEASLKAEAARRRLNNITWLGFINQTRLPSIYSIGDVFIMPSEREPWGLVLNEAMASGLVPIVSRDVGAAIDLIDHEHTGFCLGLHAADDIRDAVTTLCRDAALRQRIGDAARVRSAQFSYDATTNGILGALRALDLIPSKAEPSTELICVPANA